MRRSRARSSSPDTVENGTDNARDVAVDRGRTGFLIPQELYVAIHIQDIGAPGNVMNSLVFVAKRSNMTQRSLCALADAPGC